MRNLVHMHPFCQPHEALSQEIFKLHFISMPLRLIYSTPNIYDVYMTS